MKTEGNLQAAFAGESQASRRYAFFAEKADKEGHPQIARLFRAASEAETIHAKNHFNAMDGIGSTKENLTAAAMGEHYEFTRMYPPFIEDAKEENNKRAEISFEWANAVEQVHHALYEAALKSMNAKQSMKLEPVWVCQSCGNTVVGEHAPDKCPICGATARLFKTVV
ncbi:MAG: rubrerythrin family protein [Chloroflexi bacterium]|nr:rubrerythrin family protein [Chloroflexota bacterium]